MAARGEDEAHKATLGATPREAEVEICRQPSVLRELIGEERPHGRPTWSYKPDARSGGSRSSSASSGSIPEICTEESDSSVLRWSKEEVAAWLAEIGFPQYESLFEEQGVCSGRVLLQLSEASLKEMGVSKVGHRLGIADCVQQLCSSANVVPAVGLVDIPSLIKKIDAERGRRHIRLYPKRIILVRHAESLGNIDRSVYATVPDNKLKITDKGKQQAMGAGRYLKELVKDESITFYVSPFIRSKNTYESIRSFFDDDQVLWYTEDPRLREQEWGNFQVPTTMESIMHERRKVGAFYYRFPTGESGADVYDRVSMFLETLYRSMKRGLCGQNAVLVSHGLFCRLFIMRFYHWTIEKFNRMWNFRNCQCVIMELQPDGSYKLDNSGLTFDDFCET